MMLVKGGGQSASFFSAQVKWHELFH